MNQAQKSYNSYDKTNIMLKITENLYHQRNLYLIKNRKNQYNAKPQKGIHSQKDDLMRQFKIQKENEFLYAKIRNISQRSTKPQINDLFIKCEEKKRQFNQKVKEFETQEIQRENMEMFKRMRLLKSFINPRELDEEYKTEHQKMLAKFRKIDRGTLLLPPLSRSIAMNSKSICKTEANKVEPEQEEEEEKKEEEEEKKENVETA